MGGLQRRSRWGNNDGGGDGGGVNAGMGMGMAPFDSGMHRGGGGGGAMYDTGPYGPSASARGGGMYNDLPMQTGGGPPDDPYGRWGGGASSGRLAPPGAAGGGGTQPRFATTKAATACRFFNTAKGCQFGDKCSFGHFLEQQAPLAGRSGGGGGGSYGPPSSGSRWGSGGGGGGALGGPGGGLPAAGPGTRRFGGPGSGPGSRAHHSELPAGAGGGAVPTDVMDDDRQIKRPKRFN